MSAHRFSFRTPAGDELALAAYGGRALLLANTASECGYTPQYTGLQTLWERYRDRGLTVLAIPCNDFGGQEPGASDQILEFCRTRYAVDFPVTDKVHIVRAGAHPFFTWLEEEFGEALRPRWNFHKYLIGTEGELLEAWPSEVEPLSTTVLEALERALPG